MSKKSTTLIAAFFILLISGMFIYAHLKEKELEQPDSSQNPTEKPAEVDMYAYIDRVDAKHYYIEGTHTFVGEIVLPTPCDLLEVNSVVRESYPEQVTLEFTVINNSNDCAKQLTNQRYKTEVTASEEASFTATFMGREIVLNIIPAAEGELPEDFELFIKG